MLHKKLKLILIILIIFAFPFSSFAKAGIGGAFSYSLSPSKDYFASFSARSDISPWAVFLNAHIPDSSISMFFDNWFINERIFEHLDFFVLWGMSFGATFEDNETAFATGARFGGGFDIFLFKRHLEFFAQTVWNPYFGIKKEDDDFAPLIRPLNFPFSIGARVWF